MIDIVENFEVSNEADSVIFAGTLSYNPGDNFFYPTSGGGINYKLIGKKIDRNIVKRNIIDVLQVERYDVTSITVDDNNIRIVGRYKTS